MSSFLKVRWDDCPSTQCRRAWHCPALTCHPLPFHQTTHPRWLSWHQDMQSVSCHGEQERCHLSPIRYCSLLCRSYTTYAHNSSLWGLSMLENNWQGGEKQREQLRTAWDGWFPPLPLFSSRSLSVCEPETSRIVVWGKEFILLFLESFCFTLSL